MYVLWQHPTPRTIPDDCHPVQKNRSARVQKQVAQIQAQAATAGKSRATLEKEKEKALREKLKAEDEKRAKEAAALLKPVQTQKVPFGVDPKTILCAFYKAGHCEKGNKCKFSHDLDVGRKVEKKNLYADTREEKMAGKCFDYQFRRYLRIWSFIQTRWILGTKRSYETWCCRSMAIRARRQMYAAFSTSF